MFAFRFRLGNAVPPAYTTAVGGCWRMLRSVQNSVGQFSEKKLLNCCHQMSAFKANMHQIVCRLGLHPRPCWESLQRSPDLLAGFYGPTSRGRERGKGRGRRRKEGRGKEKGKGKKGKGGESVPFALIL